MKKLWCITVLSVFFSACYLAGGRQKPMAPEKKIARSLIRDIDGFSALADRPFRKAVEQDAGQQRLQELFLETRLAYKKFEWAAEYFDPLVTRSINGPPVPDIEPGALQTLDPEGLQVIESLLFPVYAPANKQELLVRLENLALNAAKLSYRFKNVPMLNWQIVDAARLEVFRILTMGITGFDAQLSKNCMAESSNSLQGLEFVLTCFPAPDALLSEFREAGQYLRKNTDFDAFDRAAFITEYGNQMSTGLSQLAVSLNLPVVRYNRLLRQDAQTLFDADAFDVSAYAPSPEYPLTPQRILLGQKLFSDPVLSGTHSRSCQSCHQPEKAFTDGLAKNFEIEGKALLPRNTPTLYNAALQSALFYDSRALTLEDQVHDVMQNDKEMHGSLSATVSSLWRDKQYRKLFSDAYPKAGRTSIDTMEVMNALASYIRSLTALNSRFDQYMRGDKSALNYEEIQGFNLFMGKARCATCHYMPLFNGTAPPRYIKGEGEVIGVPTATDFKSVDDDSGLFATTHLEFLKHAFKTPTVRNASRTAPYMHNGVFNTLEELVDFYDAGGGKGKGLKIDNQTLSADSLHLNQEEKEALVRFIKSLDSQEIR